MVSFNVVMESDDEAASTPGDLARMLLNIRKEVLDCKLSGNITDVNNRMVGSWSVDYSAEAEGS